MVFKFNDNEGCEIVINIPRNLRGILLSSVIEFESIGMSLNDLPDSELVNEIIRGICLITGNDEDELKSICMDVDQIELNIFEGNLFKIFQSISTMFTSYVPTEYNLENNTFEYKDKTFVCPHLIKESFTGAKLYTKVSVAQAIEILKTKELLKAVEVDKDTRFSCFIKIVAILLHEENEVIPESESEYNILIEEKMEFFEDIDYGTAKDLYFFLRSTIKA